MGQLDTVSPRWSALFRRPHHSRRIKPTLDRKQITSDFGQLQRQNTASVRCQHKSKRPLAGCMGHRDSSRVIDLEDDLLDLPPASSATGAQEAEETEVARRMCLSTWKHPLGRCSASAIDLTEGSSASELPMPRPPGHPRLRDVQVAPGPPGRAHRQLRQGLLAATMQRLRFRAVVTRCGRTRGRKAS